MRLILRINGRVPPDIEPEMDFGQWGGTIGRASSNDWMLRDEDRTISARHAAVVAANGRYFILDTSSNGVLVGSRPVGRGNRAQLATGDEIVIGPFRIAVEVQGQTDELLDGARPTAQASNLGSTPGLDMRQRIDPLAGLGGITEAPRAPLIPDDFDPLGPAQPAPRPQVARQSARPAALPEMAVLPENFDPLAAEPQAFDLDSLEPPAPPAAPLRLAEPVLATPSQAAGQHSAAMVRLAESRILPSPDGGDIGGRAILPVARRSTPLLMIDSEGVPVLIALWRGLGLGPVPGRDATQAMAAVAESLALMLDRGVGRRWRDYAAAGDAATLQRMALSLEPQDELAPPVASGDRA